MSVRLLLDMNLSPQWASQLARHGYSAVHWSTLGDPHATDTTIMTWARDNGHVVFTHDLDFRAILALTHPHGPSVLQVRGQDVLPDHMAPLIISALRQHEAALAAGAIIVVDERKSRVRVLPL
jgi:predicted nuclease of predicted toxin-antitoxin system